MHKVGIDAISFYTSHYYLDLQTLAEKQGVKVNRYYLALGQQKFAYPPPSEDAVTLAANAAIELDTDFSEIDFLLFATESSPDRSKALGTYLHRLLKLPSHCRTVELKQACYSATAGLQLTMPMLRENPQQKILLIASDVAHYQRETVTENAQGCGAIAMVLSANPRLLAIEPESGFYTEDVMDFWQPNYHEGPVVDGKLSCDTYMKALTSTWQHYQQNSRRQFSDHHYFCYHTPFPKLVEKAHRHLLQLNEFTDVTMDQAKAAVADSLIYSREVGSVYTAGLYLALLSLLENNADDMTDARIGLYSYGSGCVAEYFSAVVQANYQQHLTPAHHQAMLANRVSLSYPEYQAFHEFKLADVTERLELKRDKTGPFYIAAAENHQRIYEEKPNHHPVA